MFIDGYKMIDINTVQQSIILSRVRYYDSTGVCSKLGFNKSLQSADSDWAFLDYKSNKNNNYELSIKDDHDRYL